MTLLHSEIGEMLLGIKRRFELLNVDNPWAVTVDNCCHFHGAILKVFPEAAVLQDRAREVGGGVLSAPGVAVVGTVRR